MLKKILLILCVIIVLPLLFTCYTSVNDPTTPPETRFLGVGKYNGEYWPTHLWKECRPEEVGINSDSLMNAYHYATKSELYTQGLLIIRKGYIVGEAYFNYFTKNTQHASYSMAKSFTSALVGIAIDKGYIAGVNEKIYQYFPSLQTTDTPEIKKKISIRHLLTMTAGFDWNESDDPVTSDVSRMYQEATDYVEYVLNKPVKYEPGTHWSYSSGEAMVLSGLIENATGMNVYLFGLHNLFQHLGMTEIKWIHDPAGHTVTSFGLDATVREYAKLGLLFLKKGKWGTEQIISEDWIDESTKAFSENHNHYGYQWWKPAAWSDYFKYNIPEDTFLALGANLQILCVVPAKELIIVRVGEDPDPPKDVWHTLEFLSIILNSITA